MTGTRPSKPDRTLLDSLLVTTAPLALGSLWYLHVILHVRPAWLLGSLGLGLGLVLGAALGLVVHLLRRGAASRALITSVVNVFGGLLLLAAVAVPWLLYGRPGGPRELIAFGAFLTIFGVLIGIAERLGLLQRLRQK